MTGDKVLRQIRNGILVGTGGSAVPSPSGQLPTSAEIEEVWGLPCGPLDLELDAVEDTAREMYSQSLWWVASLYARDPIPPPRGHRPALDSVSLSF